MRDNWYALLVAILQQRTPEQAFQLIETGKATNCYTNADISDMAKLHKTLTYKEIGRIYGVNKRTIYNRIRDLKGESTNEAADR